MKFSRVIRRFIRSDRTKCFAVSGVYRTEQIFESGIDGYHGYIEAEFCCYVRGAA